ncbi:MAG: hypothetical protein ABW067_04220 [Rhizobacter sp.]
MNQAEIVNVVQTAEWLYLLYINYEEGDVASAVGSVYRVRAGGPDATDRLERVLGTGDTLRSLWLSPEGNLWVSSADGFVGTTASVPWTIPSGLTYDTEAGPTWSATALPRLRADGLRPNITTLWGTGDNDVFAGTYGGHIYHWNGQDWRQAHDAGPDYTVTLLAFGGTGPHDVFAVGTGGTLLHFDGQGWRPLQVPGAPANETLTAVAPLPDGTVFISASGNAGRLLHGTAAALTEFTTTPLSLVDMATLGDRVLFATGDGVGELFGKDIQVIKSNFKTSRLSAGLGRVYFIEPARPTPSFIVHDPADTEGQWWRTEF